MIHSARPNIVTPVANIVFCCCVFLDLKSGDGRTYVRTTCAKKMIPTGRDFGLAEWIKKYTITKMKVLIHVLFTSIENYNLDTLITHKEK